MWVRFNHIINIAKNRKVSEFRRKWTAYFYSDRRPQRRKTSSISSFEKMDLIWWIFFKKQTNVVAEVANFGSFLNFGKILPFFPVN